MSAAARIGIAVVEHAGSYLVGTRGPEGPLSGYAEFPGGKCGRGEAPEDCAARECAEETGLRVRPERLLLNRAFVYPHGTVDLHFWLCRPSVTISPVDDHQGFRWIPAADLPSLRFPEANQPLIALLVQPRSLVPPKAEE